MENTRFTAVNTNYVLDDLKNSKYFKGLFPQIDEVETIDDFLIIILGISEDKVLTMLPLELGMIVNPLMDSMIKNSP